MKRPIAFILILISVSLLLAGTALASAPDAASYFTNPDYNKTYTGIDGLEHTMTVTWVGETWNKVGTVIYSINYEDVYQKDGDTYIDAKSATEIYENARPSYPDSTQYCVYSVNWYVGGSSEVISDYRTATTEETTTITEQPATGPASTPSTTDEVTASPEDKPTQESTYESEEVAASPSASVPSGTITSSPIPSEANADTPSNTSVSSAVQDSTTAVSSDPATSPESVESTGQSTYASPWKWVWPVIIFSIIAAAVVLAYYLQRRHRRECQDDENPKT